MHEALEIYLTVFTYLAVISTRLISKLGMMSMKGKNKTCSHQQYCQVNIQCCLIEQQFPLKQILWTLQMFCSMHILLFWFSAIQILFVFGVALTIFNYYSYHDTSFSAHFITCWDYKTVSLSAFCLILKGDLLKINTRIFKCRKLVL